MSSRIRKAKFNLLYIRKKTYCIFQRISKSYVDNLYKIEGFKKSIEKNIFLIK